MKKTLLAALAIFVATVPAFSTDYFEKAGDIGQYAIPAAGLGVALVKKDWKGCLQLTYAFAAAMAVTYGLKYTVRETRPDGGDQSFPSGHTSAACCGAAFIDMRYGHAWGLPAYAAASLVGWSRIESNQHYPLDVLAGAAIGILSNVIFTRSKASNVKIAPVAGNGSYGAIMIYKW
ncbi:MAG TPA: phosphatase PAP2 family protein [Chitinivibrionales bacterium]|nr:phosphatase PAP2 family protein [Chitinivibrionales bacterium]